MARASHTVLAARTPRGIDQLGGRVNFLATTKIKPPQVVRSELIGSDTCTALDITSRSSTPVLEMCRRLIKAGCDPHRPRGHIVPTPWPSSSPRLARALSSKSTPKAPALLPTVRCAQGRPCVKTAGGVMSARRQRLPIGCALDHLIAAGGKS